MKIILTLNFYSVDEEVNFPKVATGEKICVLNNFMLIEAYIRGKETEDLKQSESFSSLKFDTKEVESSINMEALIKKVNILQSEEGNFSECAQSIANMLNKNLSVIEIDAKIKEVLLGMVEGVLNKLRKKTVKIAAYKKDQADNLAKCLENTTPSLLFNRGTLTASPTLSIEQQTITSVANKSMAAVAVNKQ